MKTIEKHILDDFTTIPTPEANKVAIGFDLDGLFKCKDENGVARVLEYALINITYDALVLLQSSSLLVPLQKYRITDFQTKHIILDGNTVTSDFNIGILEPLIIQATSINTFNKQVYSELHPFDIIYYDITGGDTRDIAFFDGTQIPIEGLKGVIYYRKDTIQNVECWYDVRNVKYRRWLVSATGWVAEGTYVAKNVYEYENVLYKCLANHNGVVTTPDLDTTNWIKWLDKTQNWSWTSDKTQFNIGYITTDNLIMSNPIDIYTFGNYYNWVNDVHIGRIYLDYTIDSGYSTRLNNIVFNTINDIYACYSNSFGENCHNNTIGDYFTSNAIGDYFTSNTIGNGFGSNTIGNTFNSNTIGNNFYSNTIGNNFQYNTIGDSFYYNTIGNSFRSNTIGDSFNSNTIGNNFIGNTIGNYFYYNTIGDSFGSNTIGNEFRCNDFKYCPTSTDFALATHVHADYNCEIFKNSAGVLRLKYVDGADVTQITDITD